MALVRWDPIRELDIAAGRDEPAVLVVLRQPDRARATAARRRAAGSRRWTSSRPAEHFVLKADLPGIEQSDVSIELEKNVLTVAGERKTEHEEKHEGYYRLERATGSFSRSLTLPEGIDADGVTASFDNGVLEVRIPKPARRSRAASRSRVGGEPATIDADAGQPSSE